MREIKIRAWDSNHKEFLPLTREVAFIDDSGVLRSRIEGIVFSEWTGMKDRNGDDIYEGDVVQRDGHDEVAVIRFDEGIAHGSEPFIECAGGGWQCAHPEEVEVIGHLYEALGLLDE